MTTIQVIADISLSYMPTNTTTLVLFLTKFMVLHSKYATCISQISTIETPT